MELYKIEGFKRDDVGTKQAKLDRSENMVPCMLYGGDENVSFKAKYNDFRNLVYSDQFRKVGLSIEGNEHKAIIKDIQFHPTKDTILHVDFQELVENKLVIAEIPIRTKGFAKGIQDGGKIQMRIRKITIKALPKDLPDEHTIDITNVELGQSIKVRDLKMPGVEIMNSESIPVLACVIPRLARQAMQDEAAAALAAEAEAEGEEDGDAPAEGAAPAESEGGDSGE